MNNTYTYPLQHCCTCAVFCYHIGGPFYCDAHRPAQYYAPPPSLVPFVPPPPVRCDKLSETGHQFQPLHGSWLFCSSCGRVESLEAEFERSKLAKLMAAIDKKAGSGPE